MIRFTTSVLIATLAAATTALAQQAPDPANAIAAAPKRQSLTRLWTGEEMWQFGDKRHKGDPAKSWRLIPGAKLELTYSGTGPLPKPVEYVIPLEEPLPLGTVYFLSVKNWYVGTMEATLGDITRKLETPRYDWTPIARFEPNERVDKIVLRYFPSTIVADTGKEQTQPYVVQGVFLSTEPTKIPFEGGEIISLMPQAPPTAREGNYFENGSFETGLYPWGPAFEVSGAKVIDSENLDDSTAADGRRSIKITADGSFGLNNKMYALPPGKYTFSFSAKADKRVNLEAKIRGLHTSLKDYDDTEVRDKFKLSEEWQRYSVTNETKEMPGFLYTAELRGEVKEPTNIWIDAILLENGDQTDYQPSHSIEVGYLSTKPGHIYYTGEEPATIDVLLCRESDRESQATVEYKVENYWGNQVDQGSKVVDLAGKNTRVRLPLFDQNTGIFRILFTAGDSQAEMVYS
ncbi:MAG: carbohydrate binding domain-containing protein, partial [Planctomycetaceae bacterium]|nr:carbohydrate binding domain-containing protein [Planctomycetaceae bacterium]